MTEQDLRNEFKDITGDNWINSQGEPDIDYVSFLETRLIRNLGVIGDVRSSTSELKKAVSEKLKKYKGLIGSPKHPHRIEQNACECLVRELTYLDDIVEYDS